MDIFGNTQYVDFGEVLRYYRTKNGSHKRIGRESNRNSK